MDPSLPPALAGAIQRELEGVSRKDLAIRSAATTAAYRAGGTSAAAIRTGADALAYALARLPATYAATTAVLSEARARAPDFAPRSLLDAGCGPGGGSWAAIGAWPGLEAVRWVDASGPFLDLAGRLAAAGPAPLGRAETRRGDLSGEALPTADLVLASYVLAELPASRQAEVATRLWEACEGVLAIVEPGTPAGYARILEARRVLLQAGATLLAPCPHANDCPLAEPDWCHFTVRLPRSRDHQIAKAAEVPFEDERFAYLLAARPGVAVAPAAARILAPPKASKPGIAFKVCGLGGLEQRFAPRRDKTAYATARRRGWGDAL